MKKLHLLLFLIFIQWSCHQKDISNQRIITSDIDNFWMAYDQIIATEDSTYQYTLIDSLYLQKGSPGLNGIRQARNYTEQDYIEAINNHPKFWNSIRANTLKANNYRNDIEKGIEKLKLLYPDVRPSKIYFTIGALRTGGTYLDSLVLIGSEMAFADKNTDASEFPEWMRQGRQDYFNENPIDQIVFLTIQEFVHTQQKPFVHNLLSYCLHEGVGDFVSNIALDLPPVVPAIIYGKENEKVREKFEEVMFYGNNINQWLWSDAPNEFGVRDLGYYIGYQICENYYNQAQDKKKAIQTMIELDYENELEIEEFIEKADFFSATIAELYENFDNSRPYVRGVTQLKNGSDNVSPTINEITVEFSRPLNGHNTGVDFGDLGAGAFPKNDVNGRYWSDDYTFWTIPVDLEPNKKYQIFISNNFRTEESIPLKPYLIEFTTGSK